MRIVLLSFIFISFISFIISPDPEPVEEITANVYYNKITGEYTFVKGPLDPNAAAFGTYKNAYYQDGWDYLTMTAHEISTEYSDEVKSYAMGYLEGMFTHKRIHNFLLNMQHYHFYHNKHKMPDSIKKFLFENFKYMKEMSTKNKNKDKYWRNVYNFYSQIKGLMDAYNSIVELPEEQISYYDFQVMNAVSDVDETAYWKDPLKRPNFANMTSKERIDFIESHNHCSALMKVAPDFSDVWFGHCTWTSFNKMIRIFKEYRFSTNTHDEKAKVVAFSGYPGCLASIDDFYILDNNLYVTETTNSVFNDDLYKYLTPKTLLSWMRVLLANRLSSNGNEWSTIFAKHNSGTYNNQFQILDLNKIDVDKRIIENNALTIIEQIPGYTEAEDMTKFLKRGYWPSYNSARIKKIRDLSQYEKYIIDDPTEKDVIDYIVSARANIFRKRQGDVKDLDSYKELLWYNNYKEDPLQKGDPKLAIGSRKDLIKEVKDQHCAGLTDVKYASIKDIKTKGEKKVFIYNGPTMSSGLPAFNWANCTCKGQVGRYVNYGQPDIFNFPLIEYKIKLFDKN